MMMRKWLRQRRCAHNERVRIIEYGFLTARTFFLHGTIDCSGKNSLDTDIDGRFRVICDVCGLNRYYHYYRQKNIPKWVLEYYHKIDEAECKF